MAETTPRSRRQGSKGIAPRECVARKGIGLKNSSKLRVAGALVALIAFSAIGTAGAASAQDGPAKGVTNTIEIKGKNEKRLHFAGPKTVPPLSSLEIVNLTKPGKVGPHTFTLVTDDAVPKTRNQIRKCFNFALPVCERVLAAHEVEFGPGPPVVNQPNVENGNPGWDAPFDADNDGDSWYTETKDETTSRVVTTPEDHLRYFCLVHPFMRGKVKVETPAP